MLLYENGRSITLHWYSCRWKDTLSYIKKNLFDTSKIAHFYSNPQKFEDTLSNYHQEILYLILVKCRLLVNFFDSTLKPNTSLDKVKPNPFLFLLRFCCTNTTSRSRGTQTACSWQRRAIVTWLTLRLLYHSSTRTGIAFPRKRHLRGNARCVSKQRKEISGCTANSITYSPRARNRTTGYVLSLSWLK
jgi:hypothetical protein